MKRLPWHILAITIITAIAAWLRIANLGVINFYNDEYYHVNTAVGYLKTGEFKQYNFYTETVEQPYTRAKIFTWQVAKSFQWFGISEQSARLPAVVWGISLIPLLIIITLKTTKSVTISYVTGLWVTFDHFFIDQARFTRMYSMVSVLTLFSVFCLWQHFTVRSKRARYSYGAGFGICILLDWLVFKELTLALLGGLAVYITVRTVLFFITRKSSDRMFVYWWIGGASCAAILIGLRLLGLNTVPLDAAKILSVPHWSYLYYTINVLRLGWLSPVFGIVGVLALSKYRSFVAMQGMIALSVLLYFIFLSHHEEAKRYIGFVIPLAYCIMIVGIYGAMQYLGKKRRWHKKTIVSVVMILSFLIGPKLSWPTLPADGIIFQKALADETYTELSRSDVKTAYHYVAEHYQPGEIVLIQGPRYYYWPNRNIPVQELGYYKSLSVEEFIDLVESSDTGVWVVYSQQRQRHLLPEIRQYIQENFTKVETLDDTLVNVYYFNPAPKSPKGDLLQ